MMRAFKNSNPVDGKVHKTEVPIPTPKGSQFLLKVMAAGVCHSDVSLLDPNVMGTADIPPVTLGHECCGQIVEFGDEAEKTFPHFKKGDIVAVYVCNSCMEKDCKLCSTGHMSICQNVKNYGIGIDGAYADYILTEGRSLALVPEALKDHPELVAPATDAVLTPYRAMDRSGIRERVKLPFDLNVCVIGLGGLGSNLLQILRHVAPKSRIVGIDNKESALKAASRLGSADEVFLTSVAREKLKPEFDIVYDMCGVPDTFRLAQELLTHAGTIMLVGLHSPEVPHLTMANAFKETSVLQIYGGTFDDLVSSLEIVASGIIKPVVTTRRLEEVNDVLAEFEEGKVVGRMVLIP